MYGITNLLTGFSQVAAIAAILWVLIFDEIECASPPIPNLYNLTTATATAIGNASLRSNDHSFAESADIVDSVLEMQQNNNLEQSSPELVPHKLSRWIPWVRI